AAVRGPGEQAAQIEDADTGQGTMVDGGRGKSAEGFGWAVADLLDADAAERRDGARLGMRRPFFCSARHGAAGDGGRARVLERGRVPTRHAVGDDLGRAVDRAAEHLARA